jgi:long-chain acyl-CoA synthetase
MTHSSPQGLADLLEQSMLRHHDKPAFHCLGQTITFAQLDQYSYAMAAWLQQHPDLNPGDRIAIQLPNINQYPIAAFAALRAGLIIVNTNPMYTPREMVHQFNDSGAKAIIILSDLVEKLEEIKEQTKISCIITTSPDDLINTDRVSTNEYACFNDVINSGKALTLQPRVPPKPSDICILQYTGGTTGVSKGAALSHGNVIINAQQTYQRLEGCIIEGQETFVCPLPLYHIYAFCVNMVLLASRGNLNILIPNPRNLDDLITAIKPFKFTGFAGINTLFVGLCQHPRFQELDFSELKFTLSGGTTLTTAASEQWQALTSCTISEGYGLSETSPVVCLNEPKKELIGTVGKPLPMTEVELWDENDQVVEDGQSGEIVVRGPQVMQGYWQLPEETAKAITPNGFFRTGDVGVRQPAGEIKIVDRLKDMICVSGFNVYPNEIENVLTQHPDILEAAVVGMSDDKTGEAVCAYITTTNEVSQQSVTDYCRLYLTGYKIPKKVVTLPELPKSTVGKVLRRELRQVN